MRTAAALLACLLTLPLAAQENAPPTRADTLRGSITPQRAWWDVTFYDLRVRVDPQARTVRGSNATTYRVLRPAQEMQIDLQEPMQADSMVQDGRRLTYRREGNAFFVALQSPQVAGQSKTITVHYHGQPRVAQNAPWDGGFVWARDSTGAPWVATAVQGLGASAWWPNKDTQVEEPDSQRIAVTVPDPMVNVSNGRLRSTTKNADGTTTFEWFVRNPINNYNVAVNAGSYAHFSETYAGEKGTLTLDYYPLRYNEAAARRQFQQVKPMLACFESWFGPYPWYEDGFKLIETPHLGMEHQSAVAYGNRYLNGYRGRDLSQTGEGLDWDFIIVHEAGHEWFGNNITTRDIADMWVHEGFTNYSEGIYVECLRGKAAGARYLRGLRRNVQNDAPVQGTFGVNREGSSDMYYKGSNMIHTIRQIVNDDAKWRSILRGLNTVFRHQTVTGEQVQRYLSQHVGTDLSKVFEQYLTTTKIPVLEHRAQGGRVEYRWADVVPGFDMPVRVTVGSGTPRMLRPTTEWQTLAGASGPPTVDEDFYVLTREAR